MSQQFQPVRHEMHHGGNARAVNPCQPVDLVNQCYALRLVVGTTDQVSHPVNDDQMDTTVQIVVPVHALHDGCQSLASRHSCQAVHVQIRRHLLPTGAAQQPSRVFIELLLALFRVIKQHRTPLTVRLHLHAQEVGLRLPFHDRPGDQCGGVVALARPFAARNAEDVLFRA